MHKLFPLRSKSRSQKPVALKSIFKSQILSGMTPVVIGAEMLQDDGDNALSVEDARTWAAERNIPFLEGAQLISALQQAE